MIYRAKRIIICSKNNKLFTLPYQAVFVHLYDKNDLSYCLNLKDLSMFKMDYFELIKNCLRCNFLMQN